MNTIKLLNSVTAQGAGNAYKVHDLIRHPGVFASLPVQVFGLTRGAAAHDGTGVDDCTAGGDATGDGPRTYRAQIDAIAAIGDATAVGDDVTLDDITSGGTYTGPANVTYLIEIDGAGATDTFKWSKDGGDSWVADTVDITGAAQDLDKGVTVTFAATTGHAAGDQWTIECTVDSFKVLRDGVLISSGNYMTGAAQALGEGVTATFADATGHTLNAYWDIAVTEEFVGTAVLQGTLATDEKVAAGDCVWSNLTDMSWTADGIKELTDTPSHIRGNVTNYTSGAITMMIMV